MNAQRAAEKFLGEPVLAAAVFQGAGSASGLFSGGALSARYQGKKSLAASGIPMKHYPLLAVTPSTVYLFEAAAATGVGGRWKVKRQVASWPREQLHVAAESRKATILLRLQPPEGAIIELEAYRTRAPARAVIDALAGSGWESRPMPPDLAAVPSPRGEMPDSPTIRLAGRFLMAAGAVMAVGVLFPYVTAQSQTTSRVAQILGTQVGGVWIMLLGGFGILRGAAAAFGWKTRLAKGPAPIFPGLFGAFALVRRWMELHDALPHLAARFPTVSFTTGYGFWITTAGTAAALASGVAILIANRAAKRPSTPLAASPAPPVPVA